MPEHAHPTTATPPAADSTSQPTPPPARPTPAIDGPTLRAVRESMQVPLRRIARQARMSHGHLSKVERGEHGRPVTPAITAAYERVTGIKLTEAAQAVAERRDRDTGRRASTWRPGQLTDMRRQAYNATIGAIAIGGHLGEPVSRLIDSTGRPVTPTPPDYGDVAQLEQLVSVLTALDLRHGGGLISQAAKALLRWAAPMLDATHQSPEVQRQVATAVSALAARAGWAAFDVAAHEAARSLFRLALHNAARASDPDLRAHVLGRRRRPTQPARLPPRRPRCHPARRRRRTGSPTRADAAAHREGSHLRRPRRSRPDPPPDRPGRDHLRRPRPAHRPGRLDRHPAPPRAPLRRHRPRYGHPRPPHRHPNTRPGRPATTRPGSRHPRPGHHARARALAALRLATVQLAADDPEQGIHTARAALQTAGQVRSARITHALTTLRTLAVHHPDQPTTQPLVSEITAVIGDGTAGPDAPDRDEASEPEAR